MTQSIIELISQGESDTLEFKLTFSKEVIESICGFANNIGGIVLIGIENSGKIAGVNCGPESVQDWVNQIKQSTSPSIVPDIRYIEINKKKIVKISVTEFPVKPVSFHGRYFKRVFNSNHQLSPAEITNLHLQSLQLSWDSYIKPHSKISDLDEVKIQSFLEKVNNAKRFEISGSRKTIFQKLGFIQSDAPTQAAILLFGKNDPHYSIHIGRFKSPSIIIDDRVIRGTLYKVVEETMKFIISHMKVAFNFSDEIQRQEIFEYPVTALREILLNAVVHRDYSSPVDIQIKIFDQSITFFNPGKLFGDLTIDQLRGDNYQSRTRNRLVSEAFYLTRDIEKYGSGFIRIREEIRKFPTMNLAFNESGDGFIVALEYSQQNVYYSSISKKIIDERSNEGKSEGINETSERLNEASEGRNK